MELAGWYFQQGLVNVYKLIDRIIPLECIGQVFTEIEQGKVKGKVLSTTEDLNEKGVN